MFCVHIGEPVFTPNVFTTGILICRGDGCTYKRAPSCTQAVSGARFYRHVYTGYDKDRGSHSTSVTGTTRNTVRADVSPNNPDSRLESQKRYTRDAFACGLSNRLLYSLTGGGSHQSCPGHSSPCQRTHRAREQKNHNGTACA